jgi:hypothetical protein
MYFVLEIDDVELGVVAATCEPLTPVEKATWVHCE